MISLDEALSLIVAQAWPSADEQIPLDAAHRRVLAEPLMARGDAPRAAVSAMDGYAVVEADLAAGPVRLPVVARVFAGAADPAQLERGTCARIFTGAPVPPGADRVVIQERVQVDGDAAVFEVAPEGGRHIRPAGSDFRAGDILLEAGRRLDARALVTAAAADRDRLRVYRRPRVAILGTGDELAAPGQALEMPGAIPESVSFGVMGLAQDWGADVVGCRRLADDPEALEAAARQALDQAEVVVVTGGASVGERDFARTMFPDGVLDMVFAKVAIKPGKPVWFARAGDRLVLGLPGNPTSAMVTARLFLLPLLARLQGRRVDDELRWRTLPLAAPLGAAGSRESFVRAHWDDAGLTALGNQDSGAQGALAAADWLIRCPAGQPALGCGAMVSALPF